MKNPINIKILRPVHLKYLTILFEQGSNSMWGFVLSAAIAKWSDIETFGAFAIVLSIQFLTSAAISSMTSGLASVDAGRLHFSKAAYLNAARSASNILSIPFVILGTILIIYIWQIVGMPHGRLILPITILYFAFSLTSDLSRRFILISSKTDKLLFASATRLIALALSLFSIYFLCKKADQVTFLLFASTLITGLYSGYLHFGVHTDSGMPVRRSFKKVANGRHIKLGTWLMGSALAGSIVDQGIAIYGGTRGTPQIAGGWRAGSYLFGLLNPVLQVTDLVISGPVYRKWGRVFQLKSTVIYIILVGLTSIVFASFVGLANAFIWLSFLGEKYRQYNFVSGWYVIIFSAVLFRTGIMPLIKSRTPSGVFWSSIIANIFGLTSFLISGEMSVKSLCVTAAVVSSTNAFGCLLILIRAFYMSKSPIKLVRL